MIIEHVTLWLQIIEIEFFSLETRKRVKLRSITNKQHLNDTKHF